MNKYTISYIEKVSYGNYFRRCNNSFYHFNLVTSGNIATIVPAFSYLLLKLKHRIDLESKPTEKYFQFLVLKLVSGNQFQTLTTFLFLQQHLTLKFGTSYKYSKQICY